MIQNGIDPEWELAEDLLKQKQFDQAIAIYLGLADRHPGEDSYLLALAWAYHDSGNIVKAIEYFQLLLEKELRMKVFTGFAFDELVRIYKQLGRLDDLIDICEKAVAVQPEDIALLNELGSAYMKGGKPDQAAGIYSKMTAMEPDDPVFCCHLGDALIAMGRVEEADQAYRRAVEIDPSETAALLFKLANKLMDSRYFDMSAQSFVRCIESRGDEPLYRCALGDCLIKQSKIQEAVEAYGHAAFLDPASAGAYYNRLGNSLAKAGRHREAIEAFRKASEQDPDKCIYRLHMAESCRAAGLLDEAALILQEDSPTP